MEQRQEPIMVDDMQAVATRLDELAKGQSAMAVDVARLAGRVEESRASLEGRISALDQRMKAQEEAPNDLRSWAGLWLIAAGVLVSLACGGGGLLISVINAILPHLH